MKLYFFPGSCALADQIVLEWTGAPYEAIKVDKAALKAPEFLELNPSGTVPVLIDGDFVLSQNVAILQYVAELYPDARLFGDGTPRGRADVARWLGLLNSDMHPAFKPIFGAARFHPDPAVAGVLADVARANVRKYLDLLDNRLRGRDWLVDTRSIADPYLFVMLRWVRKLGMDSSGLDNLARFFERMQADRGVRAALTSQEGAPQ
jgi:glutathione S-transferase